MEDLTTIVKNDELKLIMAFVNGCDRFNPLLPPCEDNPCEFCECRFIGLDEIFGLLKKRNLWYSFFKFYKDNYDFSNGKCFGDMVLEIYLDTPKTIKTITSCPEIREYIFNKWGKENWKNLEKGE